MEMIQVGKIEVKLSLFADDIRYIRYIYKILKIPLENFHKQLF